MAKLFELAHQVYLEAADAFPEIPDIRLVVTTDAGMKGRSYAYFETPDCVLGVSPRLLTAEPTRQLGVLRHELGHAIHFAYGREALSELPIVLPKSDERLADVLAELVWGTPIYYDEELVQNVDGGVAPRPSELG